MSEEQKSRFEESEEAHAEAAIVRELQAAKARDLVKRGDLDIGALCVAPSGNEHRRYYRLEAVENRKFDYGDQVQHKGDNAPVMTVGRFTSSELERHSYTFRDVHRKCSWFDKMSQHRVAIFAEEELVLVE